MSPLRISACAVFLLGTAFAQTSTTLFAAGVGAPGGGIVLTGSAANATTGRVVRHLWSADSANGLCRIDPDLDTPGSHALNTATCIRTALGIRLVPAQLTFDPIHNVLYMVDAQG